MIARVFKSPLKNRHDEKETTSESRISPVLVESQDLFKAVEQHKKDFEEIMQLVIAYLTEESETHDDDKILKFNRYLSKAQSGRLSEWSEEHVANNRHHLGNDDNTLMDVIAFIVNRVAAGAAKSEDGVIWEFKLSDEALQKAFTNTVKYLVDKIVVCDAEQGIPLYRPEME